MLLFLRCESALAHVQGYWPSCLESTYRETLPRPASCVQFLLLNTPAVGYTGKETARGMATCGATQRPTLVLFQKQSIIVLENSILYIIQYINITLIPV